MLPEAVENLMLELCKCQKWTEQVKLINAENLGTVVLLKLVVTENLTESVEILQWMGIDALPALIPQTPIHNIFF